MSYSGHLRYVLGVLLAAAASRLALAQTTVTCPPGELCNPIGTSSTIPALIDKIVTFMLSVGAPLAVVAALFSGFLFLTAGGSEERVRMAKHSITYTIVGIVILVISKGITSIVVSFF